MYSSTVLYFTDPIRCERLCLHLLTSSLLLLSRPSLYRDDGLIMLGKCPGPRKEKLIKELHRLFMNHGLKITIASTGPSANYLEVTMDLSDGSYRPYRKPNDTPVYINAAATTHHQS